MEDECFEKPDDLKIKLQDLLDKERDKLDANLGKMEELKEISLADSKRDGKLQKLEDIYNMLKEQNKAERFARSLEGKLRAFEDRVNDKRRTITTVNRTINRVIDLIGDHE